MHRVHSVDQLYAWVTSAQPRQRAIYHQGELSRDRRDNPALTAIANAAWAMSEGSNWIMGPGGCPIQTPNMGLVRLLQQRLHDRQWTYLIELRKPVSADDAIALVTHK